MICTTTARYSKAGIYYGPHHFVIHSRTGSWGIYW